jgi:D-aminoacyl-tRNA deacylase
MRVVIQRVSSALVSVQQQTIGSINKGLLILVGFEDTDTTEDFEWMSNKIIRLRIFSDYNGLMNLSCLDIEGGLLVVSQFTLYASTKKGNRPSYVDAAQPTAAKKLYEEFLIILQRQYPQKEVKSGLFGADMQVSLVNDGPVTICIDSKNKS